MFVWIVWPLVFSRQPAHPFPTDAPTIFYRNWNEHDVAGGDPELVDPVDVDQGQDVPRGVRRRWLFGWMLWLAGIAGGVNGRVRRRVLLRYVAWLVLLFAILRAQVAFYSEDNGSSGTDNTPT